MPSSSATSVGSFLDSWLSSPMKGVSALGKGARAVQRFTSLSSSVDSATSTQRHEGGDSDPSTPEPEAAPTCTNQPAAERPAPLGPRSGSDDGGEGRDIEGVVRARLHLDAVEAGGLTGGELVAVMKRDAERQEGLTKVIAELLEDTVQRNDARSRASGLASFEAGKAPISARDYVHRIFRYGRCSPCCFVVGVLYLERLKLRYAKVCLNSNNFQRLFLVAVMVAAKYLDDVYYSNKHWAEVAGISTKELNALELEMLFRLNFDMSISRDEYDAFHAQLGIEDPKAPHPSGSGTKPTSPASTRGSKAGSEPADEAQE